MKPSEIIVHHSATGDGRVFDWSAIRRYHVHERGWDDIGYHFGVERVGGHVEVLFGRWPDKPGAHTRGRNHSALGVCVVGDYDVAPPDDDVYAAVGKLCGWLCRVYGIAPETGIQPHSAYAPKSCPGRLFDMQRVRRAAGEYAAVLDAAGVVYGLAMVA